MEGLISKVGVGHLQSPPEQQLINPCGPGPCRGRCCSLRGRWGSGVLCRAQGRVLVPSLPLACALSLSSSTGPAELCAAGTDAHGTGRPRVPPAAAVMGAVPHISTHSCSVSASSAVVHRQEGSAGGSRTVSWLGLAQCKALASSSPCSTFLTFTRAEPLLL